MVFLVPSDTYKGKDYRVDLLSFGGAGMCQCVDWSTRRHGAFKDGAAKGTRATLCKHLKAARDHFLQTLLNDMAKTEEGK